MIIWLNGPFGAGKTTTSQRLVAADPALGLFDTENVGSMLRHALSGSLPVHDFQDWASWRRLVVTALVSVSDELGADLVVPQTVLVERYWLEIADGLAERGVELRPFTLHVDEHEHLRRIDADPVETLAEGWRHERRPDYRAALPWLREATTIIDTTSLTPDEVVAEVRAAIGAEPNPERR